MTTEDPLNRRGEPFFARLFTGLTRPRNPMLGAEFAGEIEAVGGDVRRLKAGNQVFGSTDSSYGCYAEYVCVPENGVVATKPSDMTFEEAAPVGAPLAAWNSLVDRAGIQSGQDVLINGASGSVGTAAVQLAKFLGAVVTGVCNTAHMGLVESLGADEVIDYTHDDFTQSGRTYDIIFDVVGRRSFSSCASSLKQGGTYLKTVPTVGILLRTLWTSRIGNKRAVFSATGLRPAPERLAFL